MIYQELWEHDIKLSKEFAVIVGVDEVGRGPLAGNVVAAAVVLNFKNPIAGIKDSKKIPESKREDLFGIIMENAIHVGVGECSPQEIDEFNILQATFRAMKKAIQSLDIDPEIILVDGNHNIPGLEKNQRCIIKGDGISASIAAASIIAKVTRDRQMIKLDAEYPEYGFSSHKGYGSKAHIKAILKYGLTSYHRKSFKPKALTQTSLF